MNLESPHKAENQCKPMTNSDMSGQPGKQSWVFHCSRWELLTDKKMKELPNSFEDATAPDDHARDDFSQPRDDEMEKLRAIIEQLTSNLEHSEHANRKLSATNAELEKGNHKHQETIVELEKKIAPLQLFYVVRGRPAAKFLDLPRELRDQIYDEVARVNCIAGDWDVESDDLSH